MGPHPTRLSRRAAVAAAASSLLLAACAPLAPVVAPAAAAAPAARLPFRGERVAVSIYEFRSSVPEVAPRGATDMFKTALAGHGRFQLVERERLNEGVVREKQLNAAGQTQGRSARVPLRAAQYIFEASITEMASGQRQRQGAIRIAGLELGSGSGSEMLGIDVRIVDAGSGEVRDAVTVRRPLTSSVSQVSGTAALVQALRGRDGRSVSPLVPDISLQSSRKDSVDQVLRGLIDDAVAQLAARF